MSDTATAIRDSVAPAHEVDEGGAGVRVGDLWHPPRRIIVFGGDGFCGWPTALYLSRRGHGVLIVDNFLRRQIDEELKIQSLTPIRSLEDRLLAWNGGGFSLQPILSRSLDLDLDFDGLLQLLETYKPDVIIHFAEIRAAPYSMRSAHHKRFTITNNAATTHNLLCALVKLELDAHLIHLGTMGVYGYGSHGGALPEGYLEVQVIDGEGSYVDTILHPANPGSIYHMSKCIDQLMFQYYARNDGLRITDLHQGIVWGTETEETLLDPRLCNRFDYDGDYGTVLNRFLVQSAIGYPLTVHGTGGQTRAFIHIRDTVRCIELAMQDPPNSGDRVRIRNQMTECHRIRDLAELVVLKLGGKIAYVPNPRKEAAENELLVTNDSLLGLGLEPTTISEGLLEEIGQTAAKYADRIDREKIPCYSTWTRNQRPGVPNVG